MNLAPRKFDTGNLMPVLAQDRANETFWHKLKRVKVGKWVYTNTLGSKTFWGLGFVIASPLTGILAPGVMAAGKLLFVVGVGDKVIKNRMELGAALGGLISALWKKKNKE